MTPQQLKNSILQRAIEGRLVEQRPEEGTAKDLLKEIRAEKERLIEEGKIKKSKPLPPITEDEKPFEIPDGWEWARLGQIFTMQAGKNIKASCIYDIPNNEHDYLCYGGNGVRGYVAKYNRDGTYPLIGRQGALCGNIHLAKGKFYATEHAVVTETYAGTNVEWAKYFLIALNLNQYATATAQPGIAVNKIEMVLIPLPPLAEQHRIVSKIEEFLPLIDKYDKAYTKLTDYNAHFPEAMKKSILQYAIQGKLVEQRPEEGTAKDLLREIRAEKARLIEEGKIKKSKPLPPITEDEKLFEIPEGWEWGRLWDIVHNHGQEKPNKPFTYIDIGSVDNSKQKLGKEENIIQPEDAPSRARKILEKGDIIYSTVRPYLHNMCIIDRDFSRPPIASTGFAVMKTLTGVSNKYLFYYLLSPTFDTYANSNENAKGVAYPAINDKALYSSTVPLPPLAEQHRIVSKIEELLPLCEKLVKSDAR